MLSLLLLAACAGNRLPPNTVPAARGAAYGPAPAPTRVPFAYEGIAPQVTPSGLMSWVLREGDGPTPKRGDTVRTHYTGWLEDGTKFDSSYDRGQPLSVKVGVGQIIPGWDEALLLMKVGEKRRLLIPSQLGYGPKGAGPIPANATLIFEVELLGITAG
jgi:FKBP-type peptidyl-prolyl cis-trans isomerase